MADPFEPVTSELLAPVVAPGGDAEQVGAHIPSLAGGAGADAPADPMRILRNTMVFNQTGHPAVSIPVGLTPAGLPVGLQPAGTAFKDYRLLAVAKACEAVLGLDATPSLLRTTGVAA